MTNDDSTRPHSGLALVSTTLEDEADVTVENGTTGVWF
jgi:hypothetical protein